MIQNITKFVSDSVTQLRRELRVLINDGSRKPSAMNLYGRRRVYGATSAAAREMLAVAADNPMLMRVIYNELYECRNAVLTATVVVGEVRFNLCRATYEECYPQRVSGVLAKEGVHTFLFRHHPEKGVGAKAMSCEHMVRAHDSLRYDPDHVEASWSIPLDRLEEGFLHNAPYELMEC